MATKTKKQAESVRKTSPTSKPQPLTTTKPVNSNGSSPSSQDTLRRLYVSLLRCRMAQQEAKRAGSGNYDIAIGHEAVIVGVTAELDSQDTIAAGRRNLASMVVRGVPLGKILRGIADCSGQLSLPEDPFNIATGIALTHKFEKKQHVAVAFCPHTHPALESWHDSLKFAGMHKLPVIYVIEDGVADQRSPSDHAPHLEAFSFMARDYGYPGIIVDGQDVVGVWRVAQESLHRARNGAGPTLIDCRTDARRDPLAHLENYMRKRNLWDEAWRNEAEAQIRAEIEKANV